MNRWFRYEIDFLNGLKMTMFLGMFCACLLYPLNACAEDALTYSKTLPVLFINTDNQQPIESKEEYVNGTYYDVNKTISKIEDTDFAFRQMDDNTSLLVVYIFYIVSIALYNIVGINLTKLVSSTARAVVDTVRTVFIWLFFLIFDPVEGTHETFYPLQLVGFLFLVFGTLVYNEILVIPWFGLNYYTRDNIAKREKEKREAEAEIKPEENERLYLSTDGKDSDANLDPPKE